MAFRYYLWEKISCWLFTSKEVENLKRSVRWTSSQLEDNIWVTLAEEAYEAGFMFGLKHLTKCRGAEASVQQGKEIFS